MLAIIVINVNYNTVRAIEENVSFNVENTEVEEIDNIKLEITDNIDGNVENLVQNKKKQSNTIVDIVGDWKKYTDEELNEIIAKSDDKEVAYFLSTLTEEELEEILNKKTMLLNEITFYKPKGDISENLYVEQEVETKETYWKYLLELANAPPMLLSTVSNMTGYFYIRIWGTPTITTRKIQVTLTGTSDLAMQQIATFSDVETTGTSNEHEFRLLEASGYTQLAASYDSEVFYEIITFKFSYKKPAHYRASSSFEDKVDGYRMNFAEYSFENNLPSTVNNTGHNEQDTTEIVSAQVNVMHCGMRIAEDGNIHHAVGNIDLRLYESGLYVNPAGGIWNGTTSITNAEAPCTTIILIQNPVRVGYTFTGWTVENGLYAYGRLNGNIFGGGIDPNGCMITYCGYHYHEGEWDNMYYTTLTANWTFNMYNVNCIDVIGNNPSGAVLGTSTWRANYSSTVSGSDIGSNGAIGEYYKNYYYTGCTSTQIGDGDVTVYRYFNMANNLEMPESGQNSKIYFLILGVNVILVSLVAKFRRKGKIYGK